MLMFVFSKSPHVECKCHTGCGGSISTQCVQKKCETTMLRWCMQPWTLPDALSAGGGMSLKCLNKPHMTINSVNPRVGWLSLSCLKSNIPGATSTLIISDASWDSVILVFKHNVGLTHLLSKLSNLCEWLKVKDAKKNPSTLSFGAV